MGCKRAKTAADIVNSMHDRLPYQESGLHFIGFPGHMSTIINQMFFFFFFFFSGNSINQIKCPNNEKKRMISVINYCNLGKTNVIISELKYPHKRNCYIIPWPIGHNLNFRYIKCSIATTDH